MTTRVSPSRLRPASLLPAAFLFLLLAAPAACDAGPVDDVRELLSPFNRPNSTDATALKRFETSLNRSLDGLRSAGDLTRALLLPEWGNVVPDASLADVLQTAEQKLTAKFKKATEGELRSKDPARQAAMATLLGESATTVRQQGRPGSAAVFHAHVSLVGELTKSGEASVRTAAAAALGRFGSKASVTPLAGLLRDEKQVTVRRAAAGALAEAMQTAARPMPFGGRAPTPYAIDPDEELFATAEAAIPAAGGGLGDADPAVRRLCLQTIHEAATGLSDRLVVPATPLPEQERPGLAEARKRLLPLARTVAGQTAAVAKQVNDADLPALIQANRTLEAIADARVRLQRLAALSGAEDDPLHEGLRGAVPALKKNLTHKEVRARLASLYVLEALAGDATDAVDDLRKSLKDDNAYVRWAAVRAFGKMAPKGAEGIPDLASRLEDGNRDVRTTAAMVLARHGAAAKEAVPALGKALKHDESRLRTLAAEALGAIGPGAKDAAEALAAALADPEAEVRRTAAGALGKVGATGAAVHEALRKALSDPDADVRRAASEALLSGK